MVRIVMTLLRRTNRRGIVRAAAGAVALVALIAGTPPALAQDDLPTRVGRLADLGGDVFHAPEDRPSDWTTIGQNYPITSGDNLWVAAGGRAEIDVGAGQVRLGPETNLHVARLDDRVVALFLAQGSLSLRLRVLDAGEVARLDTPNTQVVVTRPGLYRVEVSSDRNRTVLVVREGEATLPTSAGMQQVLPGQTAVVEGLDATGAQVQNGVATDGFDAWVAERERRYEGNRSTPYVSRQMIGSADLADYGEWQVDATYGAVWYPTLVDAGWAPYRTGSWTWVSPWGWTWVDAAPWGYAPFHYGRWVVVGGRWGWCPGSYIARPFWAPAMVGWVGGPGWGLSVTLGTPVFGWVPLAWGEPFRPWWNQCSSRCWNGYNRPYAARVDDTVRRAPPATYVNATRPGGVTAVRGATFAGERIGSRNLVAVTPQQVASSPTLAYAPPIERPAPGRPAVKPRVSDAPPAASTYYARPASPPGPTRNAGERAVSPAPGARNASPAYPVAPPSSYAAPSTKPAPSTYTAPVQRETLQTYPAPSRAASPATTTPAAVPPPVRYAAPPAPTASPQAPGYAPPQARQITPPSTSHTPPLRVAPQPQPAFVPQAAPQAVAPRAVPVAPVPQASPQPATAPQPARGHEASRSGGERGGDANAGQHGGNAIEKPGGPPR